MLLDLGKIGWLDREFQAAPVGNRNDLLPLKIKCRSQDRCDRDHLLIQLVSWAEQFQTSSPEESFLHVLLERLFPPDNGITPVGGWRTFVDGKRVIATQIDAEQILVREQLPEGFLRSDALSFGSNYLVTLITLIILVSGFAVWATTRPAPSTRKRMDVITRALADQNRTGSSPSAGA